MFHYDPADYLCPLYLQRNSTQTYNFHFAPERVNNKNPSIKVNPTSA